MTRSVLFSLIGAISLAGCAKTQNDTHPADTTTAKATAQNVSVVPADHQKYPEAKIVIVSPREGQVLKEAKDSVSVVMQVTGMDLATATTGDSSKGIAYSTQGQHVHVIVDDKPYMAYYRNGQPFTVGVLAPGLHTIRAFPSFSWHESIKSPTAFATRSFYVGVDPKDPKAAPVTNLNGPLLTYSRPKGTYKASEAQKILLDFYVTNAKLGANDFKVKLWIDGKEMTPITEWQPYYITGLGAGKHTIKLQLTDPQGNAVPGAYNSPSSDIVVE